MDCCGIIYVFFMIDVIWFSFGLIDFVSFFGVFYGKFLVFYVFMIRLMSGKNFFVSFIFFGLGCVICRKKKVSLRK